VGADDGHADGRTWETQMARKKKLDTMAAVATVAITRYNHRIVSDQF
jgi:hypothetical protein